MELDTTFNATFERTEPTTPNGEPAELLTHGALVGRYVVLGPLGVGAMGVVYAAHDPELDRRVALKLVLPRTGSGSSELERIRLLREAQALAKLSHPNVVAVHDMGTHGERVWVAMELVEGQTLHAWALQRAPRWPEALRILRDVARGVAAAHAAGLVHRDLKPDNVMIGADGRVRVMDFGLAHGRAGAQTTSADATPGGFAEQGALSLQLTQVGALQGTPAFMAPEQWRGHEATPAADQFAWSVTAWQLLYGERPFAGASQLALATAVLAGKRRPPPPRGRAVPKWLRRVVERGLATEPERRWPDMTALLAALERARTRARLRTLAIAAIGLALALAVGVGLRQRDHARRVAGCAATADQIDAAWHPAARDRLRAALLATGLAYASRTADQATTGLDAQVVAWKQARTDACMRAEVEGSWDADTLDRAAWCLEDRRAVIESLIAELTRADPSAVQRAVTAVDSLGAAADCVDVDLLRRLPAPPGERRAAIRELRGELARARALGLAGRHAAGLALAERARERAEALAWAPLTAAAHSCEGVLLRGIAAFERAEAAGVAAYFTAAPAEAWDVAAEAATELVFVVGYRQRRTVEGRAWAQHAAVAIQLAGDPDRLREAQRLNSLAALHFAAAEYPEARAAYEAALQIREAVLSAEHPAVAATLSNLAMMNQATGALAEARAQAERALALTESALGPDHPDTADSLANLGHVLFGTGDHAGARDHYARALAIREAALGGQHPAVAESLSNLASAQGHLGEREAAVTLHERALAIKEATLGRDHGDLATSLNGLANVYLELEQYERARVTYERAIEIWTRTSGAEHPDVARGLGNLADVHAATGDLAQAQALVERSLAIKEKALGRDHPQVAVGLASLAHLLLAQSRPAEALPLLERAVTIYDASEGRQYLELAAHLDLARALLAIGGDRGRAIAEATLARDGLREAGPGATAELAEAEAWLADRARGR